MIHPFNYSSGNFPGWHSSFHRPFQEASYPSFLPAVLRRELSCWVQPMQPQAYFNRGPSIVPQGFTANFYYSSVTGSYDLTVREIGPVMARKCPRL